MTSSRVLTKKAFVTGHQCTKLLWWGDREPDAAELKPDKTLQDRFDQGQHVTELARERFASGYLVPPGKNSDRLEATMRALAGDSPALFEAAFEAHGTFVSVDILKREGGSFALIEVKSATSVKDTHIPDLAVQLFVARTSGLSVTRTEVMHLNTDFRHPDHGDLFARKDVTEEVEAFLPRVSGLIAGMHNALNGPIPEVSIGIQCYWEGKSDKPCPFHARCWPDDPWHISNLYNTGPKRTEEHLRSGITSIRAIAGDKKLKGPAARQVRALETGRMIVEPTLGEAIERALGDARLGYLDFETVNRAVPVWIGLGPWRAAVVQFSYHRDEGSGRHSHQAYLAEGPHDPQPELAERMLEATRGVDRILMYSPYERTQINQLAERVPAFASELKDLASKLVDLAPLVRDHVYHPGFNGSFSIKSVLNPLVPDLTYSDLAIVDGKTASVEIARLLFVAQLVKDRDQLRTELLAYCERDTWAMVKLLDALRQLSRRAGS